MCSIRCLSRASVTCHEYCHVIVTLTAAHCAADHEDSEGDDAGDDEGQRRLEDAHVVRGQGLAPVASVLAAADEPCPGAPRVLVDQTRDVIDNVRAVTVIPLSVSLISIKSDFVSLAHKILEKAQCPYLDLTLWIRAWIMDLDSGLSVHM